MAQRLRLVLLGLLLAGCGSEVAAPTPVGPAPPAFNAQALTAIPATVVRRSPTPPPHVTPTALNPTVAATTQAPARTKAPTVVAAPVIPTQIARPTRPSPTLVPPSPIAPRSAPLAYTSGGLGLSVAEWEHRHGAPNVGSAADGSANYEQNKYVVSFWGGVMMTILRQTGDGNTEPLALAKAEARAMLPVDARRIETHTEVPTGGGAVDTVEVYMSSSLVARYPHQGKIGDILGDFPWWDGGPGSIGIIYYGNGSGWILGAGYAKQ